MDRRLIDDLLTLTALISSAALFYLAGPAPVAALGLTVFVVLSWIRLDLGLLTVLIFLPYFMHPKRLLNHPFPPSEWLLIAVAGVAVLIAVSSRVGPSRRNRIMRVAGGHLPAMPHPPDWQRLRASPFLIPGIVFFLAAALSSALAAEVHVAARDLLEVVIEPMILFALVILFFPSDTANDRNRALALIGFAVVLTGLVPSFIGLAQLVTHQNLVPIVGAAYERIKGPYSSPDNLGLLLDRTIPMGAGLLLGGLTAPEAAGGHRGPRAWVHWDRLVLALCLAVMGIALLFTFVLGAWLGVAISTVILLLASIRPGWWIVLLVAMVVIAGVALGSGRAHSVTAGQRVDIWKSSLHMLRDHPIFGVGLDNFQHYYTPRHGDNVSPSARSPSGRCLHGLGYMEPAAGSEPCQSHPHNEILDFWLSTGVLGLASFVWLQFVFWSVLWRRRGYVTGLPLLLGAGGAMLASLLHGLVDNSYFLVDLSMLTWVLFAIASIMATSPDTGMPARPE